MKRLIVSGAVLLGCFSSLVTGCGSRSSDNDYLPAATAGESGLGASAGAANVSGASAVGGASAGFTSAGGAGGFNNTAGASGSGTGGSHFAGAGGAIGSAGGPVTAGAGGASGASFAGSGGTAAGGTSSAGAATGGSATGGAAMGGTTSTGGAAMGGSSGASGGSSGASGAGGGNSASCPIALPNNNSMCSTAALQCNYTGRSCACRAIGNNLIWRCTGSGNACPSAEPTAATACMGTLQCPYPDGNQCNCGASGQWNCFTAGCPANKPTPSGSCGSVFGQCTYGTGAGSACVCIAGGWFCN